MLLSTILHYLNKNKPTQDEQASRVQEEKSRCIGEGNSQPFSPKNWVSRPVYLSFPQGFAALRQCDFYLNGYKYDLNLPWTDFEGSVTRSASIYPQSSAENSGYRDMSYIHVGTTRRDLEEVEEEAQALMRDWEFDMLFHNSRDFSRNLLSIVLLDHNFEGTKRVNDYLGRLAVHAIGAAARGSDDPMIVAAALYPREGVEGRRDGGGS